MTLEFVYTTDKFELMSTTVTLEFVYTILTSVS